MAEGALSEETAGDRLRAARKAAGLSVEEMTERVAFPPSTYYGHENGSRGFDSKVACRYADELGVTAEWLLLGVGDGPVGYTLTRALFAGLGARGHHFHGFTADAAVFHLIDQLSAARRRGSRGGLGRTP